MIYVPYFVSAFDFNEVSSNMSKTFTFLDLLVHVGIWVAALVFEILVWIDADNFKSTDTHVWPFATASLITFATSLGIVVGCILLGLGADVTPKTIFPAFIATIEGCLASSIMSTFICVVYTIGVASSTDVWRDKIIVLLVLKVMASSFINANSRFYISYRQETHSRLKSAA
jgi:hypothetical protein